EPGAPVEGAQREEAPRRRRLTAASWLGRPDRGNARPSPLRPLPEHARRAAALELERHQVARSPDEVEPDAAQAADLRVDPSVVVPEEAHGRAQAVDAF